MPRHGTPKTQKSQTLYRPRQQLIINQIITPEHLSSRRKSGPSHATPKEKMPFALHFSIFKVKNNRYCNSRFNSFSIANGGHPLIYQSHHPLCFFINFLSEFLINCHSPCFKLSLNWPVSVFILVQSNRPVWIESFTHFPVPFFISWFPALS